MEVFIVDSQGRKRLAVEVCCDSCGSAFKKRKSFVKSKNYCSIKCSSSAHITKVKYNCDYCGETFTRKASAPKGSKSGLLFCKRACKDAAQRLSSGVAAIQPPHYGTANGLYSYRDLAFPVFPKTCMACGWNKYEQLIEVHHIDSDRSNNDISNLAVLCPTCHRAITLRFATMGSDRVWTWVGKAIPVDTPT